MKQVSEMTVKELSEIASRVEKLEVSHKQYAELGREILEMAERLRALAEKIDPLANMTERKHPTFGLLKEPVEELYAKLKEGTYVDRKFIEMTYPDLEQYQVSNILTKLAKCPQVKKTKDGIKVRLFI